MNPAVIRQQIENLLISYPELAEDEVLRADMIEGSTDAIEFLRIIERRRQEAASMAAALAENIVQISERQERFDRREKAMRAMAFKIMETADLKKIEMPEATYSIRNGQQKLIGEVDPETLPPQFKRVLTTQNSAAIKEALKAGTTVTGFTLSNAEPSLSIRTK